MIKVDKSKVAVPAALTSTSAANKRKAVLKSSKSWNSLSSGYKSLYRKGDVVTNLEVIYNKKCCFCEQRVKSITQPPSNKKGKKHLQLNYAQTIEHYRPKGIYRWLAYSWDNLLLCCEGCNNPKGNDFPIEGTQITTPRTNDLDAANIHNLAVAYNAIELPMFPHPELENPQSHLTFDTNGLVHSDNPRYQYLIKTCGLNEREELREARKKIYDDFKTEYDLIQSASASKQEKKERLGKLVNDFYEKCNRKEPFTAYRLYILKNVIKPLLVAINN